MQQIWLELLNALGLVLRFFHNLTAELFGGYAWTVAIVLLTLTVRLVMMPLAVRQFRSMQAMQNLRPQMKKIQQRYKADRGMMRTDPEKYRAQRQKQQEELAALYKEHNVNPASSCLPLIAQMPIFIALFSVLRSPTVIPELVRAPFPIGATLQQPANTAGVIAMAMLVLMGITTFVQQKQMMGRQAAMADDQQMQQQKMMLYIMPVFLTVLGFQLPVGVLVYWVTTNLWQMGQQWYMLREMQQQEHKAKEAKKSAKASGSGSTTSRDKPSGSSKSRAKSTGAPSSKSPSSRSRDKAGSSGSGKSRGKSSGQRGKKPDPAKPATGSKKADGTEAADTTDATDATDSSDKSDAERNGHRPGGPKNISKKQRRDETGDKRR
jgi:YidC/Oxa1 family membrane protein insertase